MSEKTEWTYSEILNLVYEQMSDNDIGRLLTALHQDLGREIHCPDCNKEVKYKYL